MAGLGKSGVGPRMKGPEQGKRVPRVKGKTAGRQVHKPLAVAQVQTELPAHVLAERPPHDQTTLDRERTEAELRRLTSIVRNSNDAVIIQSVDGEILAWNRGAELMYGYTEAEAVGMNTRVRIPPDLVQEAGALAGRVAAGEKVDSFETKRMTKDGRTIDVWLTVTALIDAEGGLEAIATTERDITPLKQAEETIRNQQAELAHMSRVHAVGEFAAAMAHEVNQPLCAIGANARAAQRMIDANVPLTQIHGALEDILRDVERASRVVQGLKDQLRRCEPEYSTLDINRVVTDIAPIAEAQARCMGAKVRFRLGAALGPVAGDPIQLQQVLLNLVRNGLEAMSEADTEHHELLIETGPCADNGVRVSVRDYGVGLSDMVAEHMFEPFFTTKREGMGMGLAICSSIITTHGGRLWASRQEGGGCTLHFSLPYTQRDHDK